MAHNDSSRYLDLETSPLPYQSLDPEGRITDVNSQWEALTGVPREEAIGRPFVEFMPPEDQPKFAGKLARLMERGGVDGDECTFQRPDGEVLTIAIYGKLITAPEPDDTRTACLLVDVTAHRETQGALEESEERYRALFEMAPYPVIIHNGVTLLMANQATLDVFGYTAEEAIGQPIAGFVAPESKAAVAERVKRMLTEDWVAPLTEECFLRADGTVVEAATVASRVTFGGAPAIHVVFVDLSEIKKAERAREESEARYQALFEMSADAMVVSDGASVLFANAAAREKFGTAGDERGIGRSIFDFIHPDSREDVVAGVTALFAGRVSSETKEVKLLRVDGSEWLAEVSNAVVDFEGRRVVSTVFRDLTERRATERLLEDNRVELERLVEERTRLLAKVRAELDAVTKVIRRTVEIRDPYTAGHQRRVAVLARAIATRMGLSAEDVETVTISAELHDIGKVSVPAEILSKPSRLSAIEYELVKEHAQAGYEILASAELEGEVATIVLQHHERLDGSGYPQGLTAEATHPSAKILAVADVVEAMTSHRPYRPSLGVDAACEEIDAGRGTLFDAAVVDAATAIVREGIDLDAEMEQ